LDLVSTHVLVFDNLVIIRFWHIIICEYLQRLHLKKLCLGSEHEKAFIDKNCGDLRAERILKGDLSLVFNVDDYDDTGRFLLIDDIERDVLVTDGAVRHRLRLQECSLVELGSLTRLHGHVSVFMLLEYLQQAVWRHLLVLFAAILQILAKVLLEKV
jgi:hypothetical protein